VVKQNPFQNFIKTKPQKMDIAVIVKNAENQNIERGFIDYPKKKEENIIEIKLKNIMKKIQIILR